MAGKVGPRRLVPMEMFGIHVAQSAEPKKPLVRVEPVEGKRGELLAVDRGHILEPVAQPKGAVVTEVVAQEHVIRRSLGGRRLQGWVRIEERHHRRPAVVRNPMHAHPAIVVRQVFDQPIDRVVGVGRFVDTRGITGCPSRPNHRERAFGAVLPPNILANDQILIANQRGIALQLTATGRLSVIRRSDQQDRKRRGRRLRAPDHRIELDAVAHRDHRDAVLIVGRRALDSEKHRENRNDHGVTTETSR